MQNNFDIIIIGGGIVGVSTAYKLSLQNPNYSILILEKENALASHQTGRNSGVIHSGIYYKPGSYKAINCVKGRKELVEFAKIHNIPHDICGKIIVATHPSELTHLNKVFENGIANGVEGIKKISAKEITEIEPHCKGIEGIHVPCTGIIDYKATTEKLAELFLAANNANKILLNIECKYIVQQHQNNTEVNTKVGSSYFAKHIIACAGLLADRIVKPLNTAIVGFRGDYYDLTPAAEFKVKHLIYPVPNPKYPFLGVHFTRMIHGGIECGPNAVFVFDREGYSKWAFSFKDTLEAFKFKGTWRFFFKNWKFGIDEYRGAFSKAYFLKRLQTLLPNLKSDEIVPSRAGIRAMALSKEGFMLDDFNIEFNGHVMNVINSPSPAATAALAYGEEIANTAKKYFNLN